MRLTLKKSILYKYQFLGFFRFFMGKKTTGEDFFSSGRKKPDVGSMKVNYIMSSKSLSNNKFFLSLCCHFEKQFKMFYSEERNNFKDSKVANFKNKKLSNIILI